MSIASLQRSRMSDPEAKQGPDNMIVRCNNLYCDALFIVVKSFSIAGGLPVDKLYFYTIRPARSCPLFAGAVGQFLGHFTKLSFRPREDCHGPEHSNFSVAGQVSPIDDIGHTNLRISQVRDPKFRSSKDGNSCGVSRIRRKERVTGKSDL